MAPRRRRSRVADPASGFRSWKRGGGQWRAGEFLAGFGRRRGERRRGAPDLPEPSGEGSEGGRSEAAFGGAAPGWQVASILRRTGVAGKPQRRMAPLERGVEVARGKGRFLQELGRTRRRMLHLGGAETGPTRVGRQCHPSRCSLRISLGTLFFVFQALIPGPHGFLAAQQVSARYRPVPSFPGNTCKVNVGSPVGDSRYITISTISRELREMTV